MANSPSKSNFNRSSVSAFASSRLGGAANQSGFSSSRMGAGYDPKNFASSRIGPGVDQKNFASSRIGGTGGNQSSFASSRPQYATNPMASSAMYMNNARPMLSSMSGAASAAAFNQAFANMSMAEQQQAGIHQFPSLYQQQMQAFLLSDFKPDPCGYGCFEDRSDQDEYNFLRRQIKNGVKNGQRRNGVTNSFKA